MSEPGLIAGSARAPAPAGALDKVRQRARLWLLGAIGGDCEALAAHILEAVPK